MGKHFLRNAAQTVASHQLSAKEQSLDSTVQSVIEERFEVGLLFPDSETVDLAIQIANKNYLRPKEQQLRLFGSHDLYYCYVLEQGKQAVKGLTLAVPWFKETPQAEKFSTEVKIRQNYQFSYF